MATTKNLCAQIPIDLHERVSDERERLGQTVVIVTHDEHLAAMADRKITMSDGRIL